MAISNIVFYALGNIGDSKKTDYTRAYDPEDMNEFTIEISDNTKNNATFQTGVYLDDDGERQIEEFTITEETDGDDVIQTAVSVAKPQSFVYPITMEEWESEDNMRHWCLYNEGFDGDHSFEPRYACCGDYRDGKLVNDTTGNGAAQIAKNAKVWRAFYRWVITSTNQQFVDELDQWVVPSAMEFYYAFTHMYTMMDNRAKNCFFHFGKTGTYKAVSRPVEELLHVYCEKSGNNYVPTTDTSIVSGKTYYTQHAFDMWVYDTDTALGINNNGELIFPYGKEDIDYNIDGQPSSGWVYNGALSTFWCRLRDLCADDITRTFNTVVADEAFSATHLLNEFDTWQNCYPEEIWRLDIQRKYIRTFTGESIDNSKPKHDVQYLRDMMQGRKKYQRRQWVRDQEIYFGTKNLMNTVVGDQNRITFRCYTPEGDDIVVEPDYTLKITPYSDMYVSVTFGNGDTRQVRAKGGTEYEIECPLSTMTDTQVIIYGANRIQALNDLSACYIAANNFSMATKLRKLVLGNTTEGYNNSRLTSLTLGSNKLLEELDIRNCGNLAGSINLAQCSNLLKLYAEGTRLTGVTFATNGKVKIVHLPSTITSLTMRNLDGLTDFQASLDRLETLTLQGGNLDSLELIEDCLDTLQTLYLYDIDWTLSTTEILNDIYDLFYSLVTGQAYISGQIRTSELTNYNNKWQNLDVTYNPQNLVQQYPVYYVNADDENTLLFTDYVDRGSTPRDIYSAGLISKPTLTPDAQYVYNFGTETDGEYDEGSGWSGLDTVVLAPTTVRAVYSKSIRSYYVKWWSRPGLMLAETTVNYGSEAVYPNALPTDTSEEATYIFNLFKGWDKSTGYVKEDLDVYAQWERVSYVDDGKELNEMTEGEIFALASRSSMEATPNARKAYIEDRVAMKDYADVKLGFDPTYLNVESEIIAQNVSLDGETYIDKNIKLFDEDSPSFTLAIDFIFGNTDANNTLLACYEDSGNEGFRLRYNGAPNIQWGDKSQNVGNFESNKHYRDIVVLRHVKGSNNLVVYHANSASAARFQPTIQSVTLTRSRATSSTNILTLGAIRYTGDGGHSDYGTGHIFWAKIWYDDLGNDVAKKMASWCHETMRMEFCGSSKYALAGNTSKRANLSFIANNTLSGRGFWMNSTNTNAGGWDECLMRDLVNGRLYDALPIAWKSMIKKVKVNASAGSQSTEVVASEDYIYLHAIKDVDNSQTSAVYTSESTFIPWFVANGYTNTVGGNMTVNATRIKFKGVIIPEDATYYFGNSDPVSNTENDVKTGDVWVNSGNSSIGYIFLPSSEFLKMGFSPTYSNSQGGWFAAGSWWLRSPLSGGTTTFCYVYSGGTVYSGDAGSVYALCGGFSV